ncbi:hypothetical protein SAMN05216570_1032 [Dyella sp. OK004]|uniref:sulfite exporter TauE/SafE family protein n=1 Tax=Dyella sp. OK004 TaxID=1855292 RepID=UPI0008EB0AA8|nr:sulfite exporter TauE/SafE family protein [Dyella sp. OK004]SFR94689.1 hypothetical protein SAMN05216570_1032 [Dyella sp. OK004]
MLVTAIGIFALAFLAFGISALSGGGAGLLLMPMLGLALPSPQVPAALSIGSAISSSSRLALFFKRIDWTMVRWFVPAAIPAVWLGAWLLSYANPLYLQLAMGVFLLANLPLLIKPDRAGATADRKSAKGTLMLIGAAAGFVSGLTGAVGLLFNRFYLRHGLTKEQVIATRAANEIILHAIKVVLYALFGLLTQAAVLYGLLIGLAALLATGAIRKVLPYLSEHLFKRIGYGAMVLSGIAMLGHAGNGLARQEGIAMQAEAKRNGWHGTLQWRDAAFSMEFKYSEGFEVERVVSLEQLPRDKQQHALLLSEGADTVMLEEVHAIGKHYFEVYAYRDGVLTKHKI